jgi:serine/threonine-protein kinase
MFAIGLMTLALAALLAYLALSGLFAAEKVEVPSVVGKQLVQARATLDRAGFQVKETRVRSQAEFDTVVDQDPEPGKEAGRGSTVTLVVSNGPGNVRVPSVQNLPLEQAVKDLSKVDLKVNVDNEPSDSIQQGFAIRTVPKEGAEVERGTRVRLFVSSGPSKVTVPDVVGLDRASAQKQLDDAGLAVTVQQEESDKTPDEVLAQSPGAGSHVDKGTRVTITVAKSKPKATVPDVVGLSADDAARQIRNAKLTPVKREKKVKRREQDGQVISQSPGGGAEVDKGDSVVIVVGKFEQPEPTPPPAGSQPTPAPG